MKKAASNEIHCWFNALAAAWGPQHWWPARSRFEVIVGAFLTQNTNWRNVERALANLIGARALSPAALRTIPLARLEQMVRPAGYFRQKARRLKNFVRFLDRRYGGSLPRMFRVPTMQLRQEMLALNGIGPETADSILLYAGSHPVFVVDAYTRRVAARHGLLPFTADYEELRELFERALATREARVDAGDSPAGLPLLPGRGRPGLHTPTRIPIPHPPSRMSRALRGDLAQRYNEMHGLLVNVGKYHCHKHAPHCEGCPLEPFLPARGPQPLSNQKKSKAGKTI